MEAFHGFEILTTLADSYLDGDHRVSTQLSLTTSHHKERLKDVINGCVVAASESYRSSDGEGSGQAIELATIALDVLTRIVNQQSSNQKWISQDLSLLRNVIDLLHLASKTVSRAPQLCAMCIQCLDNLTPACASFLALETTFLDGIVRICRCSYDNSESIVWSALTALLNVFTFDIESSYFKYLDKLYSLELIPMLIRVLQGEDLAMNDITVAETGLSLLALIIQQFGPNAMKAQFEAKGAAYMTGSEGFHNVITDLVDLNVEEAIKTLIEAYLPYSVAVISAAIHVLAVLAPYYEEHPALKNSYTFGQSAGLHILLAEWMPRHRISEAAVAEDYATILYYWCSNLHRIMEALYKVHIESMKAPAAGTKIASVAAHRAQQRKNSLMLVTVPDGDGSTAISPMIVAQFSQHTAGKGSILVPSIRVSFISSSVVPKESKTHEKVLIERPRAAEDRGGGKAKKEYEPFSLLVYHHRLVPGDVNIHVDVDKTISAVDERVAPGLVEDAASSVPPTTQSSSRVDESTLMAVLVKSTLALCHDYQRKSFVVAEYTIRILFRVAHQSPMAWMHVLQAGGLGQMIQCIKTHGRHQVHQPDEDITQVLLASTGSRAVMLRELLFAEVASTTLARAIAMTDTARFARYLIIDLQVMEVVSQYLLSSYAFLSKKVLGHCIACWITLCDHRTASMSSQRIDIAACCSSVALLAHYLKKYDTLQANPFIIRDESEELLEVQEAIRLCLEWIDRIVSFERNRPKLLELNLPQYLHQVLRHHYPAPSNESGPEATGISSETMALVRTRRRGQSEMQQQLVILTLQVIRGMCHGIHSGNILLGGKDDHGVTAQASSEQLAMRQLMKHGFIPVLLRVLTFAIEVEYVREIVLLAITILTIFATKHKLQLGHAGCCEVLHQLLVFDVTCALERGVETSGLVDEELSESLSHLCTAIHNMAAQCEDNKAKFIELQSLSLLQQLSRAPYCSPLCKNELKDAINMIRFSS